MYMCTGVMGDALVDLLDQCWPVSKRDVELATKDKVKLHRIGPLGLNVVHFEPDVWRHEPRLDRADVDPKHVDVGKGFGKVDGPCCSESCQSRSSCPCFKNLQIPVPVPRSKARCTFEVSIGARKSLLPTAMVKISFMKSRRSDSICLAR